MKNILRKIAWSLIFSLPMFVSSISYAQEQDVPSFECTLTDKLTDQGRPTKAKSTFATNTSTLYFVCLLLEYFCQQLLQAWLVQKSKTCLTDLYPTNDNFHMGNYPNPGQKYPQPRYLSLF